MTQVSRRAFVALAAAGTPLALSRPATGAAVSAQDVVDRIRKGLGVEWKPETIDTFKAGDPAAAATGIVTTAMATLDVLQRAVKAGANMVITCEPTFYSRADTTTPPPRRGGGPGDAGRGSSPPDPVVAAKAGYIEKNRLVVWRFGEHWRLRTPDPFAAGLVEALGWRRPPAAAATAPISIADTTLDALASHVSRKLNARGGIRVVGDPRTKIRTVGVLAGSTPIQASLALLPGVDAIVAGEVREWESVEYARDTVAAGGRKGLILAGRVLSEDPGMRVCARWLTTLVPEVKTTWMPAGDAYWRPL